MNIHIEHPTQLWISDEKTLNTQIILYLQKKICSQQGCQSCVTCTQISTKEHPWIIWTTPERSYALEQIDNILQIASFQLDQHEQRFFILPQAERLSDHCSNRLLKTIEEPASGYHFFFLTSRPEMLPLTIQSRCIVQKFQTHIDFDLYKDLLQPFLSLKFNDPINFIKQIDTLEIKEQESLKLADDLYDHWTTQFKQEIQSQTQSSQTKAMVMVLQQALSNPAMTGGAKIFWKNLYLLSDYATKNSKS